MCVCVCASVRACVRHSGEFYLWMRIVSKVSPLWLETLLCVCVCVCVCVCQRHLLYGERPWCVCVCVWVFHLIE